MENYREQIEELIKNDVKTSPKHLYVIIMNGMVKIGKSSNIKSRIVSLLCDYYYSKNSNTDIAGMSLQSVLDLADLRLLIFTQKSHLEKYIHRILKDKSIQFEHKFGGCTEFYPEDIAECFKTFGEFDHTDIFRQNFADGGFANIFAKASEKLAFMRSHPDFTSKKDAELNWVGYKKKTLEKYLCDNGQYKVGPFRFSNKTNLTHFNRVLLSEMEIGRVKSKDVIDYVTAMFSYHPSETRESIAYIFANMTEISVRLAEYDQKYSVFVISYKMDGKIIDREFSCRKCIVKI